MAGFYNPIKYQDKIHPAAEMAMDRVLNKKRTIPMEAKDVAKRRLVTEYIRDGCTIEIPNTDGNEQMEIVASSGHEQICEEKRMETVSNSANARPGDSEENPLVIEDDAETNDR